MFISDIINHLVGNSEKKIVYLLATLNREIINNKENWVYFIYIYKIPGKNSTNIAFKIYSY